MKLLNFMISNGTNSFETLTMKSGKAGRDPVIIV